jgi:predicted glycosyltransferase
VIITGPFMPMDARRMIFERAKRLGVRTYRFYRWMEKILAAADLVICMGGYNTVCEILSQKTVSLLIPRETPRKEQLIRAEVFNRENLVDYIPWRSCTPEIMREKIHKLLKHPESYRKAISKFRLTGLDTMIHQLHYFRNNNK